MPPIFPGRWTADLEGDFVVFLIGMRANRPWKLRKTLLVGRAMGPILRDLEAHPEKGCLGSRQGMLGPLSPLVIQFWRDFDALERYAKDDMLHSEPWKRFFRVVGLNGDVGIWHETFQVRAGAYEAVYGNMPRFGLAAAGEHRGLGSASRARERMGSAGRAAA
ncbi:MAG: DUF4188 domain-containing protein [Solirubrobacteraceae bacterium]|jgi:hypothetical protein|nr:DUF4188 domain-containing protein [Solirubrobacteraceae bacterium]